MIRIPRLFGLAFDLIHDLGWRHYLSHVSSSNVEVFEFGDCGFICENDCKCIIYDALDLLQSKLPSAVELLKQSCNLYFLVEGDFPEYSRVSNFKFLIHRNTANYGVDGVLSIIAFGTVLEDERRKVGTLMFRLFPPDMDEVKEVWIGLLRELEINDQLIDFYKNAPLQRI